MGVLNASFPFKLPLRAEHWVRAIRRAERPRPPKVPLSLYPLPDSSPCRRLRLYPSSPHCVGSPCLRTVSQFYCLPLYRLGRFGDMLALADWRVRV